MNTLIISINDVQKRSKKLAENSLFRKPDSIYEKRCIKAIQNRDDKQLSACIEQVRNISNFDINLVLECFDTLTEVGTIGKINSAVNSIITEAEAKVRDASALNNLLKQRLGRLTHKNATKLNKKLDSAFDAVNDSISQIQSKLQVSSPTTTSQTQAESAVIGYMRMIDESVKLIHCDRILENYGSISKRFNIDKLFIENVYTNGVEDTVNELCKLIDTYNMDIGTKFNTVIESSWYALNTNHIQYDMGLVLEASSDYFLQKDNGLYACRSIIEDSVVITNKDKDKIYYISKDKKEEKEKIDDTVQEAVFSYINKSNKSSGLFDILSEEVNTSKSFQDIFNDFKKNNSEGSNLADKLLELVKKLYSGNVENVIEGTPNFLSYIRRILILSTGAINPILMIVALIANEFISIHMEREEVDKMIKAFKNEKNIARGKANSSENPEEKERLEEYIKSLDKAINKIESYQLTLLSDKEIENKYNNDYSSTDDFKNDVDPEMSDEELNKMLNELDDSDFDFSFGEGTAAKFIPLISSLCESLVDLDQNGSFDKENISMISIMSDDDIKNYATFSTMFPDCINPDNVYVSISKYYDDITREGSNIAFESSVDKYHKMSACKEAMEIISNHSRHKNTGVDIYENCIDIYCQLCGLKAIREFNDCLVCKDSYILEASFTNKLKLAGENLRRSLRKMSDKEKEISKTVDVNLNHMIKGVEKSLTNDNRAAVINGSILPSASKVIKLAITTGLAYLIQPALAVVTVLGYIGISKGMQAKERKRIIDEIDIELKMCNKYIEVAETKNDMDKLKQLYTIQRELERQRQRLKYNLNAKGVVLVEPTSNGGY